MALSNSVYLRAFFCMGFAALISCTHKDKNGKDLDTATRGRVSICADPSVQPLVEAEQYVFEASYPDAHIQIHYLAEHEAITSLLQDSARIVVLPRLLTPQETKAMEANHIRPRSTLIAKDAIAVIINPDNLDSNLTQAQLYQIFSGKAKRWVDLKGHVKTATTPNDSIRMIVDEAGSSEVRYIKDSILKGGSLPPNLFATGSNRALLDYIAKHKNAIGLIGTAWISDRNDATTNQFLKTIRVVNVAAGATDNYLPPYAGYIKGSDDLGHYPMVRNVYVINGEWRVGLGTGFTAFMAGDKGQRIVYQQDLLPGAAPTTLYEVKRQKIQ